MFILNKYCALCSYATDIINSIYSVQFDKVPVTKEVSKVKVTTLADGFKEFGEVPYELSAPYGRNIEVKGGTNNVSVVVINGFDYLGQKMTEKITLNNTTKVIGKKSFKFVSSIFILKGTADTITVTEGLFLGLPYRTAKIIAETRDGVESTASKLVVPVNTTQSATTGDSRGTINLGSYSSPKNIVLVCMASPEVFDLEDKLQGGLHGIPQYFE